MRIQLVVVFLLKFQQEKSKLVLFYAVLWCSLVLTSTRSSKEQHDYENRFS